MGATLSSRQDVSSLMRSGHLLSSSVIDTSKLLDLDALAQGVAKAEILPGLKAAKMEVYSMWDGAQHHPSPFGSTPPLSLTSHSATPFFAVPLLHSQFSPLPYPFPPLFSPAFLGKPHLNRHHAAAPLWPAPTP